MSQEELADELNVSQVAVSSWESGLKQPTSDKIRAIARKLKISVASLILSSDTDYAIYRDVDFTNEYNQIVELLKAKEAESQNDEIWKTARMKAENRLQTGRKITEDIYLSEKECDAYKQYQEMNPKSSILDFIHAYFSDEYRIEMVAQVPIAYAIKQYQALHQRENIDEMKYRKILEKENNFLEYNHRL